MKKDKLVDAIAAKCGCSKTAAEDCLDAVLEIITDTLSKGEEVALTGFGVFRVLKRAARKGVNPRTREKISIPEMKVAKFRAGKKLKEAVK